MHLHGHKFWVLGTGTGPFPYATTQDAPTSLINLHDPPYRDTVELPPAGWAVIRYVCAHANANANGPTSRPSAGTSSRLFRYVTDNPGAWLMHCHLQWHVAVSDRAGSPRRILKSIHAYTAATRAGWQWYWSRAKRNCPACWAIRPRRLIHRLHRIGPAVTLLHGSWRCFYSSCKLGWLFIALGSISKVDFSKVYCGTRENKYYVVTAQLRMLITAMNVRITTS